MTTEYGDGQVARDNEILRTESGSGLHGLAIEGTDDHDELGVFVEPPEYVFGLEQPFNSYVYRTQPEGHRSGHGDTDLTMYSLRHYIKLALAGNPSILTVLFAPEDSVYTAEPLGQELMDMRELFLSKKAVQRHLGYLDGQLERLQGGGKRNRVPSRPELIEKYGYDTKYASHALRLAYQGLEIALFGSLTLPMPTEQREHVKYMKTGGYETMNQAIDQVLFIRDQIEYYLDDNLLAVPSEPAYDHVQMWLIQAHLDHWETSV